MFGLSKSKQLSIKYISMRLILIAVIAVGGVELFSPAGANPALAQEGTVTEPQNNIEPEKVGSEDVADFLNFLFEIKICLKDRRFSRWYYYVLFWKQFKRSLHKCQLTVYQIQCCLNFY